MTKMKLVGLAAIPIAVAIAAVAVFVPVVNSRTSTESSAPSTDQIASPTPVNVEPYLRAIRTAADDGLRVWLEADLVKRWLDGPASFQQAVSAIGTEAKEPGVVGIKIADELGYEDGLKSIGAVERFLDASAAALHAAAPGKLLLVDMLVPELGCMPDTSATVAYTQPCVESLRYRYKQLSLSAIDAYLHRHDIDVVDISTGLFTSPQYAAWGVTSDDAQSAAWREIARRGWPQLATIQSRKALAHPGADTSSAADVDATLRTFVDVPHGLGAVATDVWTWRQLYTGKIYRLLNPGLQPNGLWDGLVERHRLGIRLFTHFSPNSVEASVETDMSMIAKAFTDVFVATGTG